MLHAEAAHPSCHARLSMPASVVTTHGWPEGSAETRNPDWAWRATMARDERPDGPEPPALRRRCPLTGPIRARPASMYTPRAAWPTAAGVRRRHRAARGTRRADKASLHNVRLPTYGGLLAWELEKAGQKVSVRPEGDRPSSTVLPMYCMGALWAGYRLRITGACEATHRSKEACAAASGLVGEVSHVPLLPKPPTVTARVRCGHHALRHGT